ncbi:hypothetical protein I3A88_24745 [Salmonella enterica]|nr:hypothetical protein [Salmonella enterica subsp. enterica]MBH0743436.1 hypothetical protein [Salmonella enterica]
MLKLFLTGLFTVCLVVGNAYAGYENINDVFWGMLKKEKENIVFVRCDAPSRKMKIIRAADANQKNVEKMYQIFN